MLQGRSYTVNWSPTNGKVAKKYPAVAHLPYILDARPGYHRVGNAYLIERGMGRWAPRLHDDVFSGKTPTVITMGSYAAWLANFLEWADVRSVDLQTCDYAMHVAGQYQTEMLKGIWSSSGEGLSPSTVNSRVQQACDFLNWMHQTGRRNTAFHVPYKTVKLNIGSATSSVGHLGVEVQVREGKAPEKQHALVMPTDARVKEWLKQLLAKKGYTVWLMAYTILVTAMRREELVCLREDTLPLDPEQWQVVNPDAPESMRNIRITLTYGTKGPGFGEDNGDKIGKSRDILIPLELANLWHAYREDGRASAFGRRMKGVKGAEARRSLAQSAVHLFLREDDGTRFTGPVFINAWKSVLSPFGRLEKSQQWSPHSGRHWWACSTLWRELQKHSNMPKPTTEVALALLENTALSIIRLHIQPQLGHSSPDTTMLYLRWITAMVSVPISLFDDEVGGIRQPR